VSRDHPLAWHRVLPVLAVVVLACVAVLAVRGPDWYQRLYHPLSQVDLIGRESRAAGLDPYVVAALINVESGFREDVTSKAGAVGLMQVRPSTAHAVAAEAGLPERVTAETLRRPGTNVRVGVRYLAFLKRHYGRLDVALAAYNAGMSNVEQWYEASRANGSSFSDAIGFPATRYYVQEIESQAVTYRRLYPGVFGSD
jgi:soluble lytic murein transglycosylase